MEDDELDELDLTDPETRLTCRIIDLLEALHPEVNALHASIFIFAAEGGNTVNEAVAASDINEAAWIAAHSDMHKWGLVKDTEPWELTKFGDAVLDDAAGEGLAFLRRSKPH
jgi:hypothetical protein